MMNPFNLMLTERCGEEEREGEAQSDKREVGLFYFGLGSQTAQGSRSPVGSSSGGVANAGPSGFAS